VRRADKQERGRHYTRFFKKVVADAEVFLDQVFLFQKMDVEVRKMG
jgi:hypothetical protein